MLSNSNISRRITKKEIVYKKNKSKSIITIQISKRKYLKVFLLNDIEEVIYQSPSAGERILEGETVRLFLKEDNVKLVG